MKFVDLFCGAGGWSEGLKRAGWHHLAGADSNPAACDTYRMNHGRVVCRDIRQIKGSDLTCERVDVIVASPPCQSVSMVGSRAAGDARDVLYKEVVRLTQELKPRYVAVENVRGFASKRLADGTRLLDATVREFEAIGYECRWRVLRAEQFGLPQRRHRVVLLASACGQVPWPFPEPSCAPPPTLSTVLEERDQVAPFYWMSEAKAEYYERRAAATKYVRFLDPRLPSPTVRAAYLKSRGAEALLRYADGKMRMLTEKECARLQGFGDAYEWRGPRTAVYPQIGNAVPPPLAQAIGASLLTADSKKNVYDI